MVPLAEGLPVLEAIVKVEESVTIGAKEIEFPDENFTYCSVES